MIWAVIRRPLGAHCHLGLGILYSRVGRCEDAQAELSRTDSHLERYNPYELRAAASQSQSRRTAAGAPDSSCFRFALRPHFKSQDSHAMTLACHGGPFHSEDSGPFHDEAYRKSARVGRPPKTAVY
jgi:hypothetical protein